MATNNESDCENELFKTALEEYFSELTLSGDEFDELSRITNNVLTPRSADFKDTNTDPDDADVDYHLALTPDCAKDYFQSSTPKRDHEFVRPQRKPKLLVRFAEFKPASDEIDIDDNQCGNHQTSACSPVAAASEVRSLSVIIRDHHRHLILSPFSQHLKDAISRQEILQKRKQRIEDSKKAQRASLRI